MEQIDLSINLFFSNTYNRIYPLSFDISFLFEYLELFGFGKVEAFDIGCWL